MKVAAFFFFTHSDCFSCGAANRILTGHGIFRLFDGTPSSSFLPVVLYLVCNPLKEGVIVASLASCYFSLSTDARNKDPAI